MNPPWFKVRQLITRKVQPLANAKCPPLCGNVLCMLRGGKYISLLMAACAFQKSVPLGHSISALLSSDKLDLASDNPRLQV
jgi:hypothetical protein